LPAAQFDGSDVLGLANLAQTTVGRIRKGEGPEFLEVLTYRWKEHVGPNEDYHLGYRTEDEASPWIGNDSVRRLGSLIDPDARADLEQEIEEEIAEAFAFAEASPFPESSELLGNVYKED
jgi:pyruvate dehydrogenase E1 component alpha subunit